MKIRMTTSIAGPEYVLATGDEKDFPEAEAVRLIEARYAVPADTKKETATKRQPSKEKRG